MEVPAPFAGTVKEIKIATGDKSENRFPDHGVRSGWRRPLRLGCG
ncbi:hypothetical protein M8494_27005 [Serratia ureilytica]